jgi:hypothetical protein
MQLIGENMNREHEHVIETAIDEAMDAVPDEDHDELTVRARANWVLRNRWPTFSAEVQEDLVFEILKDIIREQITLIEAGE